MFHNAPLIIQKIFGSLALGLATTLILTIVGLIILGPETATKLWTNWNAIAVILFGACWYPFINHYLTDDE